MMTPTEAAALLADLASGTPNTLRVKYASQLGAPVLNADGSPKVFSGAAIAEAHAVLAAHDAAQAAAVAQAAASTEADAGASFLAKIAELEAAGADFATAFFAAAE
jgi:hypothetical protein